MSHQFLSLDLSLHYHKPLHSTRYSLSHHLSTPTFKPLINLSKTQQWPSMIWTYYSISTPDPPSSPKFTSSPTCTWPSSSKCRKPWPLPSLSNPQLGVWDWTARVWWRRRVGGRKVTLAGAGIAICDDRDNLLFQNWKSLKACVGGRFLRKEAAELEARVEGLNEAICLKFKNVKFFCDDILLYNHVSSSIPSNYFFSFPCSGCYV